MTVLLQPQEPGLSTALAVFLSRQGCPATVLADESVEVDLPHELHGEQARLEVDLYVRLWQALQGGRLEVDRVDSGGFGRQKRAEEQL